MLLKLITVFSLFLLWRKEVSANPQPQNVYRNTSWCLGNYRGPCSETMFVPSLILPTIPLAVFQYCSPHSVAGGTSSV